MSEIAPAMVVGIKMTLGRRLRRLAWRVVRLLVIAYVAAGILLYALQTKLIFIGHDTQGTADAVVQPLPGTVLVRMTAADGVAVVGLFGKAELANGRDDPQAGERPTVLFFYGNAMCMNDAIAQFEMFREAGANCMLVDYEGYGMSGGEPSEAGCYAAAEAAYQYLLTRADINKRKIVPAGWSLGGGVAIEMASRHAGGSGEGRVCGLITFCSFTSMAAMGQYHYPMFPVSLLLKHRFLSEEKLAKVSVPYLIGHGRHDTIIPFGNAERLAAAAKGPVSRVSVESDHNDFFDVGEAEIKAGVGEFLKQFSTGVLQ